MSGLTTGSCLKDGGNHDDEQDGAEIGPHKASHNAGFVKRLSLEDGFDSREEDKTTVPQNEGDDKEEDNDDNEEEENHNLLPTQDDEQDLQHSDEEDEDEESEEEMKKESLPPPPKLASLSPTPLKSNHSSQSSPTGNASQQSLQSEGHIPSGHVAQVKQAPDFGNVQACHIPGQPLKVYVVY